MTMATNLTEACEAAVRDGAELMPWTAPNVAALEDERLEAAVVRALAGPVAPELAFGVPLLRFANTGLPAQPLIQAVMNPPRHGHHACDRCSDTERSVLDRLWVPAGASVVEVAVCWRCRLNLDMPHRERSTLVWS